MRCAVLGSPIEHSLSPVMHRAAYAELGLDWTYEAVDVPGGTLAAFLSSLGDDVRGFSITAPLKKEAAGAAHHRTEVVELLGIANTLVIDDDRFWADNTDVPGAIAALAEAGVTAPTSARILGGGATAASIAYALADLGLQHLELVVRDPDRALDTAVIARGAGVDVRITRLDEIATHPVDLLVSTIPVDSLVQAPQAWVEGASTLFDVIYDPWPTPLAAAAQAAGVALVSGLDLLAHQAALQVRQMTGGDVDPHLLRGAAMAHLGR